MQRRQQAQIQQVNGDGKVIAMYKPSVFISYSWGSKEFKEWVNRLAQQLRKDGVMITFDDWDIKLGDPIPQFMEEAIAKSDYVLIICTADYKRKSNERTGGVGYESNIITAEVYGKHNHRKFIPVLAEKLDSIPDWLLGKRYLDISTEDEFNQNYPHLLKTLKGRLDQKDQISQVTDDRSTPIQTEEKPDNFIKIMGVVAEEATQPRNDGTPGSALYAIPFRLNKRPSYDWAIFVINRWNSVLPTTMHRPGIARVEGDKIILDGTTIEEVEKFHAKTLRRVVSETNLYFEEQRQKEQIAREEIERNAKTHVQRLEEVSKRIKFE